MYNISKNGIWAVSSGGNPPEGQINLAASSSYMAGAGRKRRAQGIKMNPLGIAFYLYFYLSISAVSENHRITLGKVSCKCF